MVITILNHFSLIKVYRVCNNLSGLFEVRNSLNVDQQNLYATLDYVNCFTFVVLREINEKMEEVVRIEIPEKYDTKFATRPSIIDLQNGQVLLCISSCETVYKIQWDKQTTRKEKEQVKSYKMHSKIRYIDRIRRGASDMSAELKLVASFEDFTLRVLSFSFSGGFKEISRVSPITYNWNPTMLLMHPTLSVLLVANKKQNATIPEFTSSIEIFRVSNDFAVNYEETLTYFDNKLLVGPGWKFVNVMREKEVKLILYDSNSGSLKIFNFQ